MSDEQPQPDLDTLRRDMLERQKQARAAVRIYNRRSWIRFTLVFVPVPLVVVTFRLHLEAWHYYVLGGAFIFFAGPALRAGRPRGRPSGSGAPGRQDRAGDLSEGESGDDPVAGC